MQILDALYESARTGVPVIEVHRVALSFGEKPVEYRVSTIDTSTHDYVNTLSKPR